MDPNSFFLVGIWKNRLSVNEKGLCVCVWGGGSNLLSVHAMQNVCSIKTANFAPSLLYFPIYVDCFVQYMFVQNEWRRKHENKNSAIFPFHIFFDGKNCSKAEY